MPMQNHPSNDNLRLAPPDTGDAEQTRRMADFVMVECVCEDVGITADGKPVLNLYIDGHFLMKLADALDNARFERAQDQRLRAMGKVELP